MRHVLGFAVVLLAGCSSQWELGCEGDSCGDGRVCVVETSPERSWCTVPCSQDTDCLDVEGVGYSFAVCIRNACQLVSCRDSERDCPQGFTCGVLHDLPRCVPSP
ncbi:Hypothetical protein I5071_31840 [Sandaracinus amylolyticus]|nr:Hypothetical protein I5071_31840 [Sandaracinus amylolyticus]